MQHTVSSFMRLPGGLGGMAKSMLLVSVVRSRTGPVHQWEFV